jgi:hypothetical protein
VVASQKSPDDDPDSKLESAERNREREADRLVVVFKLL